MLHSSLLKAVCPKQPTGELPYLIFLRVLLVISMIGLTFLAHDLVLLVIPLQQLLLLPS
jgi:hypothetical protein